MSGFASQVATPGVTPPDPTKHVNYTLGMVLGVEDFTQEFAYSSGRDQWMVRELIGYGTVCGLRVTVEADNKGPRVEVTPGVAISPPGQMIRVTPAQCAYLNDWLAANKDDLNKRLQGQAGNAVTLYVVLCYGDCPTDQVPIPGEPCRSEEDHTHGNQGQGIQGSITHDAAPQLGNEWRRHTSPIADQGFVSLGNETRSKS